MVVNDKGYWDIEKPIKIRVYIKVESVFYITLLYRHGLFLKQLTKLLCRIQEMSGGI